MPHFLPLNIEISQVPVNLMIDHFVYTQSNSKGNNFGLVYTTSISGT